jgi:hypothetical protein
MYESLSARAKRGGFAARERERVLREWLESELPLLLSQAYVPMDSPDAVKERFARIRRHLDAGAAAAGELPGADVAVDGGAPPY